MCSFFSAISLFFFFIWYWNFNLSPLFTDFWWGTEQHPHHRRPGEREELRGNLHGPARRSVWSGPEEGERVRSLLRLRPVHHLLHQLGLLQVWRLLGATGGAPLQLGVQVRGRGCTVWRYFTAFYPSCSVFLTSHGWKSFKIYRTTSQIRILNSWARGFAPKCSGLA